MKVNPLIKTSIYGYSEDHKFIDIFDTKKGNIGLDGENLTICVLSCNRSSLTINLMNTINLYMPNFKGELLIIDNNSEKEEKILIKKHFLKMKYLCRIIEFDKNFGVAGGRNKSIEYVNTDWILNLDNDIYFTGNPLKKINEAISTIGCHFLNMPLMDSTGKKIFANGGHLYVQKLNDNKIHVGGGSLFAQENIDKNIEFENSISTFLFGGASIINKHTFIKCGMFDENMFIGFEDTDFSLRLFKMGYKIGNCGINCLVHDHKIPKNDIDKNYEKERFSNKILKESADYFEKKNGMIVWTSFTDEWLENKKIELGIEDNNLENSAFKDVNIINNLSKENFQNNISLILDSDSWAFANIAKQIKKNLSKYYNFKIIPMNVVDNIGKALLISKDSNIIHFFWRPQIELMKSEYCKNYVESLFGDFDDFQKNYVDNKIISTCIYDHLFLEKEDMKFTKRILNICNNYYVSSNKLKKIYTDINDIPKPLMVIQDGVDLDLFKPYVLERFNHLDNRTINVGWVGNSKWVVDDLKGINTIIKPAIENLKNKGYNINLITSDREDKFLPHELMPSFYKEIDLYICASIMEGTPNPVLESMACGIPVISTDVGIVPEVFGKLQKDFIVEDRNVKSLESKIEYLLNNKYLFNKLSKENIDSIKPWDWKKQCLKFKEYFEKISIN